MCMRLKSSEWLVAASAQLKKCDEVSGKQEYKYHEIENADTLKLTMNIEYNSIDADT